MFRTALLLICLAGTASAQALPGSATPPAATPATLASPTAADTVQAIHQLFARHRRVGNILVLGAVAADLGAAGISAASEGPTRSSGGGGYGWSPGSFHVGFGGFAAIYGIMLAPVIGVGVEQLIAYGPKHEARVLADYGQNHRLSAKYNRKIRKFLAKR